MTAYENVAFAMRVTNIPGAADQAARALCAEPGGARGQGAQPAAGAFRGEQQRIALARACAFPAHHIADEPTGNIDPELSYEIVELLTEINKVGTTIVMVTHEHELVAQFDHRIIQIEKGRLVADTGKIGGHNGRK